MYSYTYNIQALAPYIALVLYGYITLHKSSKFDKCIVAYAIFLVGGDICTVCGDSNQLHCPLPSKCCHAALTNTVIYYPRNGSVCFLQHIYTVDV